MQLAPGHDATCAVIVTWRDVSSVKYSTVEENNVEQQLLLRAAAAAET